MFAQATLTLVQDGPKEISCSFGLPLAFSNFIGSRRSGGDNEDTTVGAGQKPDGIITRQHGG
jgi:hypothetical protein